MTLSTRTLSLRTLNMRTLSITTLSIMTLSIMTLSITILSIMTFTIMTFSIMTLSIMTVSIRTLSITTFIIWKFSRTTLSITKNITRSILTLSRPVALCFWSLILSVVILYCYVECRDAERNYAECHIIKQSPNISHFLSKITTNKNFLRPC
jgi:hypothetical protein